MKYNAFHYDMDGVLINSEPLHVGSERMISQQYGLDVDYDNWNGFKGRKADDIFQHLHDEHTQKHGDKDIPNVDELVRLKTNLFIDKLWEGEMELIDGAMDLLKWTRSRTYDKHSLVTSSEYRIQQAIFHYFNLAHYFDAVVTGNDVRIGKPHPGPYLKALRLTGAKASESLVFEDSKAGIISARGARIDVMALTSDYYSRESLATENPKFIVDNWRESPHAMGAVALGVNPFPFDYE